MKWEKNQLHTAILCTSSLTTSIEMIVILFINPNMVIQCTSIVFFSYLYNPSTDFPLTSLIRIIRRCDRCLQYTIFLQIDITTAIWKQQGTYLCSTYNIIDHLTPTPVHQSTPTEISFRAFMGHPWYIFQKFKTWK